MKNLLFILFITTAIGFACEPEELQAPAKEVSSQGTSDSDSDSDDQDLNWEYWKNGQGADFEATSE